MPNRLSTNCTRRLRSIGSAGRNEKNGSDSPSRLADVCYPCPDLRSRQLPPVPNSLFRMSDQLARDMRNDSTSVVDPFVDPCSTTEQRSNRQIAITSSNVFSSLYIGFFLFLSLRKFQLNSTIIKH